MVMCIARIFPGKYTTAFISLQYLEINGQLFLFLNNRHWQEMDKWKNMFIHFVKTCMMVNTNSVYKTSRSRDGVCLN